MLRVGGLNVSLQENAGEAAYKAALKKLRLSPKDVQAWHLSKCSVDARDKGDVHFVCTVDLSLKINEEALLKALKPGIAALVQPTPPLSPLPAASRPLPPVVIGMGPCGLFAALYLARAGLNPICLERGKNVDERKGSVSRFFTDGTLDEDCNVQFGEGGAGAFSDGKLTTGIKDPRCRQVLEVLHAHGAPESILWQAHPHVGTDRLPQTVASIRREIESLGGKVIFSARVCEILSKDNAVRGLRYRKNGETFEISTSQILLSIGHSARDTFQMLYDAGVHMEQKPFSVGVRIEHKQQLINVSQYGPAASHPALGAAEYHLSAHLPEGRGVYSFCMCPGGQVIAAASESGGVCTNGMSVYARDGENANAALLVDVRPEDYPSAHPLAGLSLQREWEKQAFEAGGRNYFAPVQRCEDFLKNRETTRLGDVSPTYRPGVTPADLRTVLPAFAVSCLQQGIRVFSRQIHGFDCPDALLTGVEARSSSPLRIPRDETMQSSLRGLYPAGEGAGYAGGIMSAAVDGLRVAEAIALQID